MIDLNRIRFKHLEKQTKKLKNAFSDHLDHHIKIPGGLMTFIFPQSIFQSDFYLVFPNLFHKAFHEKGSTFVEKLCISGFLYFKYLLCVDALLDNDADQNDAKSDDSITLLKSHIYHEESLKILAHFFGKNPTFWQLWNQRNNEFLKSTMLDKGYNIQMTFANYTSLSAGKCSFSKVAVDAYYSRRDLSYAAIYKDLIESIDLFSIARCIQDDLEDFKKDLVYKKNNWGHVLLNKWLLARKINIQDLSPDVAEKYLFTSEIAEEMLTLSKNYYQRAVDKVMPYKESLSDYVKVLDIFRNNVNFYKVNIQAYRIDTLIKNVAATNIIKSSGLPKAIELSANYIANMQNTNGSWYEVSNMQGLSNVWSTGFIASFLDSNNECLSKAGDFLLTHKQGDLWGYNTDWTYDFDSTTCALLTLDKLQLPIHPFLGEWFKSQKENGGFSTYSEHEHVLFSNLGLKKSDVKGWINDHTCVSALAYYFLNSFADKKDYQKELASLRSYLIGARNKNGTWQPYWWTSYLYPTCFMLQGMQADSEDLGSLIDEGASQIVKNQNGNGSFSCEVLKKESAFYTALALDTFCSSPSLFKRHQKNIMQMKEWLLTQQYSDGSFSGSDFLVIPNPNVKSWSVLKNSFTVRKTGGGNSITGEVANLFTTAISNRALKRFEELYTA